MRDPRGFLEDNYGRFSEAEQALISLLIDALDRIERLEAQVANLRKNLAE